MFFHVYIAPGQGQTTLCGQNSVNRKAFSLCPFVVSFKTKSLKSDFIHIFAFFTRAPSSEFVSSSIPSCQVLTARAQPFREARDLAFRLKVPL